MELAHAREPAGPVGDHVGVHERDQAPARLGDAEVVRGGISAVPVQTHDLERQAVEVVQQGSLVRQLVAQLRGVEDVDQLRGSHVGVVPELRDLVFHQVGAPVQRDDHGDLRRGGRLAVLDDLLYGDRPPHVCLKAVERRPRVVAPQHVDVGPLVRALREHVSADGDRIADRGRQRQLEVHGRSAQLGEPAVDERAGVGQLDQVGEAVLGGRADPRRGELLLDVPAGKR